MPSFQENLPDWTEIDTPWERGPIAWRQATPWERDAEYHKQIADPANTHLIRETLVHRLPIFGESESSDPAATKTEAEDAIAEAKDQFTHLEHCGIRVAPEVSWHVLKLDKAIRVLARVAIINGEDIRWPHRSELWLRLGPYKNRAGLWVREYVHTTQYLNGAPRISPDVDTALTLVDIDPANWCVNSGK